jgi:transposase-like protein
VIYHRFLKQRSLHGKRMPAELLLHVMASLAERLGIRAVARAFGVDSNTVLVWLIEAAARWPEKACQL